MDNVLMSLARKRPCESELFQSPDQLATRDRNEPRQLMDCPLIGGMGSPHIKRAAIHSSRTSISSLRASSMLRPVAHTPSSSGTSAKQGSSPLSMSLYCARSRAAWMYSVNISRSYLRLLRFNVILPWAYVD